MSKLFLGIDCGTQGTKALLVDEAGSAYGRGYAKTAIIERASGAREQEPQWWVDAMIAAVREAMQTAPAGADVVALSVSGQQHGLVVLDEKQQVIRPAKLWNDTETASQNAELLARFGGEAKFFERFGIVPRTGYTVSKLLWMAEREPDNFARMRHILLPHEYLNFRLTGEMRAEYGDASGTAFFDVRTREWSTAVLDAIDGGSGHLSRALPALLGSEDVVGALHETAAAALGLTKKCLVASGGGDNMMGAIGTGNVREGVVTLNLGTSSTVYSFSDSVPHDPTGNVAPFCSSSGGWLPLVCTMNATGVVTGTVEMLGKTVEEIDAALEATKPGADGLVFLPFLNGERTPDLPEAKGSLLGITPNNLSSSHLIRAAVEGVTFGILDGLDLVMNGRKAEVIQLIGGGARSKAWRQMLADATGATIRVPAEPESGCLGAAVQAMVAYSAEQGIRKSFVGVVDSVLRSDEEATCDPRPELRSAYDVAREQYRRWLFAMYPHLEGAK